MVIRDFGAPQVFEERELPTPEPGPNEVLVRVYATSINPVDYKIRRAGSWAGVEPPAVIGYDVSGVTDGRKYRAAFHSRRNRRDRSPLYI